MKLINDFFNIIDSESADGVYKCKVKLNANHHLYNVHFPGNPITPGVCLLQMATEILEQYYGKNLLLQKAGSIKFKKIIIPTVQPTFVFSKTAIEDGCLKTVVMIEDEDNQFVKMSLTYSIL